MDCLFSAPYSQPREFADLYSKTRGANRHVTIKRILSELLPNHPQTKTFGFQVPQFPHYFAWVDDPKSLLSNNGLKLAIAGAEDLETSAELSHILEWAKQVNWAVEEIVKGIPPFPYACESLELMRDKADMVVVSATPLEALEREWVEHGIASYTALICGQEMGTKKEQIAAVGPHYPEEHVLMIGDAPGDMLAAKANGALFYPIIPGDEIVAWKLFYEEGIERLLAGTYAGEYEKMLIERFERALPERPSWEVNE